MKEKLLLILLATTVNIYASAQYETARDSIISHAMNEDEMQKTVNSVIESIMEKEYNSFIKSFHPEVRKFLPETNLIILADTLNYFMRINGVPEAKDIVFAIEVFGEGNDKTIVNKLMYSFGLIEVPNDTVKYNTSLIFSFIEGFGTEHIIDIQIKSNPFLSHDIAPSFSALKKFDFAIKDIRAFRIYYDEGEIKKTKYGDHYGVFAIEGDLKILEESGLINQIKKMFSELQKSEFESVEVFTDLLNRDNTSFIQIDLLLDKDYGLFLYLPIESGDIILRQVEFGNLGYQFTLSKDNYPSIVESFHSIIDLPLQKYYHKNP
jgi:hypothetical protein